MKFVIAALLGAVAAQPFEGDACTLNEAGDWFSQIDECKQMSGSSGLVCSSIDFTNMVLTAEANQKELDDGKSQDEINAEVEREKAKGVYLGCLKEESCAAADTKEMKEATAANVIVTCITQKISNKAAVEAARAAAADAADGGDGESGDAAKEGDSCTMGNDDCGYEADQKLICAEADMSGASMTDDQKKKLTDAGASDDDITKAEEAMQAMGTVAVCTASANCESDSEKMKEADDMGVSVTCSAKALAGAMVAFVAAAATM